MNKIKKTLNKILKLMNKYDFTTEELVILYGNLGYCIGASIGKYEKGGPSIEELKQLYYTNPTIDVAFMLQGLTVLEWNNNNPNKE